MEFNFWRQLSDFLHYRTVKSNFDKKSARPNKTSQGGHA